MTVVAVGGSFPRFLRCRSGAQPVAGSIVRTAATLPFVSVPSRACV